MKLEDIEAALRAADAAGNTEDAQRLANAYVTMHASQHKPADPTEGMSGTQKFFAGMGKGMTDLGQGLGERLGMVSPQEVAESRRLDAPLVNTGAGKAGDIAGQIASTVPLMAIPGAASIRGSMAVSGALGALQPTVEGESATKNTLTHAALGGAAQFGLGKLANAATSALAGKEAAGTAMAGRNAVTDEAVAMAKDRGYKTVPSISNGSFMGRLIEGATGKEKAKQLAASSNQQVTDAWARKIFGIADDAPLSKETMRGVRQEAAAEGYEPIRQVASIKTDQAFRDTIKGLTSRADNASKDFGDLVKSDIQPLADGLMGVKSFTGSSAVDAISIFREKASDLYASGNKTLGKAYREAAEAIESQVERGVKGKNGATLVKNFKDARTKMAQTFDMEKAIREGEGSLDLRALGKIYAKNPNRMQGEMRDMGRIGAAMPEVAAVPKDGWSNPVSALDSTGASMASIIAGNPFPLAVPVARVAGRYGLLSDAGQRMFATPKYGPGLLTRGALKSPEELRRLGLAGLLSGYAAQ